MALISLKPTIIVNDGKGTYVIEFVLNYVNIIPLLGRGISRSIILY
jgi:hypothetical protein